MIPYDKLHEALKGYFPCSCEIYTKAGYFLGSLEHIIIKKEREKDTPYIVALLRKGKLLEFKSETIETIILLHSGGNLTLKKENNKEE